MKILTTSYVDFLQMNYYIILYINNLHSVITDYEKEIFKNVLYEEITIKLKKINKLFEKYFKGTPFNLT